MAVALTRTIRQRETGYSFGEFAIMTTQDGLMSTIGIRRCFALTLFPIFISLPGLGQQTSTDEIAATPASSVMMASLPDAPSVSLQAAEGQNSNIHPAPSAVGGQASTIRYAPRLAFTIEPEYRAVPLTDGRKFLYAGHEIVSYSFPFRVVIAASFSQARQADPKYGDDGDAFAKRVGASAARQASQAVFSDGILATALHQDPRYYVLGDQYGFFHRFFYAATRVLVTRTDSGGETLNTSTLIGYGGAAAMAQFYYPEGHRDIYAMSRTYGFSLLGLGGQHEAQELFRFLIRGEPK